MSLSGFKHGLFFLYTSHHHVGQKGASSEFSPNPLYDKLASLRKSHKEGRNYPMSVTHTISLGTSHSSHLHTCGFYSLSFLSSYMEFSIWFSKQMNGS